MVDVDILRRLANELARDEHPFTVGTILEAADEIEALRKGVEAISILADKLGQTDISEMLLAILKGTPDNGPG